MAAAVMTLSSLGGTAASFAQAAQSQAGQPEKMAAGPALESMENSKAKTEAVGETAEGRASQTSYEEYLPAQFDINTLKAAEETDHLILAVGDGADQSSLTLWYYERGTDGQIGRAHV